MTTPVNLHDRIKDLKPHTDKVRELDREVTRLQLKLSVMREALKEAQGVLADLTKPDMRQTSGAMFFRAFAAEAGARQALSFLEGE